MTATDWIIIGTVVAISAIDIGLILLRLPTISNRMRAAGRRVSTLPFGWGVLGGHFWGPCHEPIFGSWWASCGTLVGIGVAFGVVNWLAWRSGFGFWWYALIYLAIGVVLGAVFWPLTC